MVLPRAPMYFMGSVAQAIGLLRFSRYIHIHIYCVIIILSYLSVGQTELACL